jgi:hypothetical protein
MRAGSRQAKQRGDHAVRERQAPHLLPLAHGQCSGDCSQAHRQGCPGTFLDIKAASKHLACVVITARAKREALTSIIL